MNTFINLVRVTFLFLCIPAMALAADDAPALAPALDSLVQLLGAALLAAVVAGVKMLAAWLRAKGVEIDAVQEQRARDIAAEGIAYAEGKGLAALKENGIALAGEEKAKLAAEYVLDRLKMKPETARKVVDAVFPTLARAINAMAGAARQRWTPTV